MVKGDKKSIVSIVQHENVRFAIEEAINLLGGIERFLQHGDQIVIKPNLVLPAPPFSGWVTDYPVVQAIVELCQQVKPKEIMIAEGSGGNDTELAYRRGG
ncbi:MAG: DUF362 domain-containing protein, partial [Promethearchaeota archaeon]